DFEGEDLNEISTTAAQIARAHITEQTRTGHAQIVKHYITFHQLRDGSWDPKSVTRNTPQHICEFITKKCGPIEKGYEGKKVSNSISTRAALTFWYHIIRPNESVAEWRIDQETGICHGLLTRSRAVSEFMVGLEKIKARSGEISQSARALTLDNMHCLYDYCMRSTAPPKEQRWGIVRYAAYLFAWLMVLHCEEVLKLTFESIDMIPGECEYFECRLSTRKTAQTGVLHGLRLYANDMDPKICPVQALIMLARLYGDSVELKGPLFLKL
ncbi:hypothetical protein DFH94DRAFT_604144, partial [Russula ochroleuca]